MHDREMARSRGLLVAEGRFVVRTLLTATRFAPRSILLTQPALESLRDIVGTGHAPCPVYVASQEAMNEVAGFDIHRGCVAIAERGSPLGIDAIVEPKRDRASMIVLLEGVNNHDNVGGVFRSALAFGASGVLCAGATADPLYRKAIRVSMGAALRIPFACVDDLSEVAATLGRAGYRLVALSTDPGAVRLHGIESKETKASRLVLMLGSEGSGLSREVLSLADAVVRIPMALGVDSLNVAAAASIALWRFAPPEALV